MRLPYAVPVCFLVVSSLCETRQEAAYPDKKGLALSQSEASSSGVFHIKNAEWHPGV